MREIKSKCIMRHHLLFIKIASLNTTKKTSVIENVDVESFGPRSTVDRNAKMM
jgi:hypothetical protein